MQQQNIDSIFESFPVLKTNRLDLIEITQNHLADLFLLFSNKNVTKYYNVVTLTEKDQAQKFIDHFTNRFKDKAAIRWGIALKGAMNIIGSIGYNNFTPKHRANIGYDLLPQYWNKGYITEALSAIIDFGFNRLDINRIEAEVMQGNIASEKVLQKLGFQKEGILRSWMYWNNTYYDMTMFSLLKSDYKQ